MNFGVKVWASPESFVSYHDAIRWWAKYLTVFALNPPWGITEKFTIGVPASVGEEVARLLGLTPKEVVDAAGRPCFQVDIEPRVIAVEWLKPEPVESSARAVEVGKGQTIPIRATDTNEMLPALNIH